MTLHYVELRGNTYLLVDIGSLDAYALRSMTTKFLEDDMELIADVLIAGKDTDARKLSRYMKLLKLILKTPYEVLGLISTDDTHAMLIEKGWKRIDYSVEAEIWTRGDDKVKLPLNASSTTGPLAMSTFAAWSEIARADFRPVQFLILEVFEKVRKDRIVAKKKVKEAIAKKAST